MIFEKTILKNCRTMTINRNWIFLFLLTGLLSFHPGSRSNAAEVINNLNFDFYSQENGLSNNQIHCIHQDKKGWMWFGTSQGVCRFDGYKFTVFKNDPEDSTSLKGNLVRTIFEDRKGQLWIGTENGGLNKFNREKENFQHLFYTGDHPLLKDATVTSINEDSIGNLWVGTSTDLYRIENENKLSEIKPSNLNSLSEYFRVIKSDRSGKIWLGTNNGLFLYDPKNNQIQKINLSQNQTSNQEIWDIFHDLKGDVWIGTRNGINFLIEERQNIQGYKSMPGDNRYLNSSEIYAFWVDPKGDIWAGTESGGINILDRKTGRFRYMLPQKGNQNSLSTNCIKALLDDGKNNLWIGTFLGGIDVLNLKTGAFKHYTNNPADPSSLSDNRVWSFLRDSNNDIWVGTSVGLDKFDPATGSFTHFRNLVDGQQVNWLVEDSGHAIWIGADNLVLYDPKDQKITRIQETTRCMLHDSKDRFWLATPNRGIALFSKEKGILKYYSEKNGLANNQALAILEDNEHFLWISTTNGLSKFDPASERFHNFSLKNGFQNNQFTYGAAFKTTQGELLFGGIAGFNFFNPKN